LVAIEDEQTRQEMELAEQEGSKLTL